MKTIHDVMLEAGGPGSGPHDQGNSIVPPVHKIASLKRLGITNHSDLKNHVSQYLHRYTQGGKTMSMKQVLDKIVGPAASDAVLQQLQQ